MARRPPPVVVNAKARHTATLIFLHGLGDTGHGWAAGMASIRPDFLKIVCPTAPTIPVTLNSGMHMPAWYDILKLDETETSKREDINGVLESSEYLSKLIKGTINSNTSKKWN
jgi:lysophospholipase-2